MSALQDQVASESTNLAVAIDANASKLSQDQLSAWYAFAQACLTYASAATDSGEGPDFLRQLAGWRQTLTDLGATVPQTQWQNVPHVQPPPSQTSVFDAIKSELVGPVGLGLMLWYLISSRGRR